MLYALVSTCPSPSPYLGSVSATALAWALAMVVIFVGVNLATSGGLDRGTVVISPSCSPAHGRWSGRARPDSGPVVENAALREEGRYGMRIRMLPVKERFPLKRKVMTVIERRYALGVMKKKPLWLLSYSARN